MTGFGGSLALSGGTLVVGAPAADSASGAAYIYEGGSGGWTMTTELTIDDGPGAFLGLAAQVLGDRVLVSAGDPRRQPGQIISFTREDDGWTESGRLRAFDGAPGNQFGTSMTSDGSTLWVGAPGADGRRGRHLRIHHGRRGLEWGEQGGWTPRGWNVDGHHGRLRRWRARLRHAPGRQRSGNGDDPRPERGWLVGGYAVFKDVEGIPPVLGGQVDCADGEATVFGCSDVDLVAYMPVSDLGGERGTRVNDVWGWTDPETNHDYAIVGRRDGTSFVDVTDPPNPVLVGNLPKPEWAPNSIWRDMKVYKDHVFVVSDGSPEHGMQVFDLTRLREFSGTPLTFTHDVHYDRLSAVHNIVINEETGFAYAVGAGGGGETCGGGLHMIDIRDPRNPTFAGCFADDRTGRSNTGYTHDAQCVVYRGPDEEHAGKEICLGANESHLSIADVSDKQNPVALSVIDYPNVGYSHQGWLTEDHAHFFMNDELDEVGRLVPSTRTLIWDISDLDDPILVKQPLLRKHGQRPQSVHQGQPDVPVELQQRPAHPGCLRCGKPPRRGLLRHGSGRGLPVDERIVEQLPVLQVRDHHRDVGGRRALRGQAQGPDADFLTMRMTGKLRMTRRRLVWGVAAVALCRQGGRRRPGRRAGRTRDGPTSRRPVCR